MLHFYEIADNGFLDCIFEYTISPNLKCVFIKLYSNDEFPFSHILGILQLVTGNRG